MHFKVAVIGRRRIYYKEKGILQTQQAWGSSSQRASQDASRLCFLALLSLSSSLLLFLSVPAAPHGLPERPHLRGPHFSHLPDQGQLSPVRFSDLGQEYVAKKSRRS